MLPEFLFGSYKQYKGDTSAFTTWLGRAAEACGYQARPLEKVSETAAQAPLTATVPSPVPKSGAATPRLKGKARKATKQNSVQDQIPTEPSLGSNNVSSVKYKDPTSILLEQIDVVAIYDGFTSVPS
jgi:hypothetical protein